MPPPRYVDLQIDVNEFTHVSDAEAFLARIALLTARGHLDIQSAQELSALEPLSPSLDCFLQNPALY